MKKKLASVIALVLVLGNQSAALVQAHDSFGDWADWCEAEEAAGRTVDYEEYFPDHGKPTEDAEQVAEKDPIVEGLLMPLRFLSAFAEGFKH